MKTVILASTSRYRAALLRQLHVPFEQAAPDCDESPLPDETPAALVTRLSLAKAQSLAAAHAGSLIIGSDQVADLDGLVLGKPGDKARATRQLQTMRGKPVIFRTGLCLLDTSTGLARETSINTEAQFRDLSDAEIERYLDHDTPFDCAGSFKSEQLGISLLSAMRTDDPSALIGLPLIALAQMLREAGLDVP